MSDCPSGFIFITGAITSAMIVGAITSTVKYDMDHQTLIEHCKTHGIHIYEQTVIECKIKDISKQ